MGKISSRPTSMSKDSSSLDQGENSEKLPMGPTISRPGPTLLMQVATAVKVVTKSICSRDTSRQDTTKMAMYTARNRWTPWILRSFRGLPSNRTVETALGCSIRRISLMETFPKITARATLIPPAVEPAQPPMNISATRMALEKVGQVLKSTVANPVVVMMEDTWKKACRRLVPTDSYM